MVFSAGDIIAIAFGLVGIGTWGLNSMTHKDERREDHSESVESRLTQLLSDFSAHKAEDRTELKWIKEGIGRVERKVDNVQSQLRNVATGSNDRVSQIGGAE